MREVANRMKKIRLLSVLLIIVLILPLAACGNSGSNSSNDANGGTGSTTGANIAFIIPANQTLGINDRAWIQNIWEAMSEFCAQNSKTCTYYQAVDDSKQSHVDTYELAIQNGAEVVFSCGNEAADALKEVPWDYPDVKFISLEAFGLEGMQIAPNHRDIITDQEQAGWLAGVAAVREGYKTLGVIPCWDLPTLNMWSWGYIQGLNYAAKKYNIAGISVRHHYANSASANPETQALAASWYSDGVDCIQCNTAGGNNSVIAAATAANKPVFGADSDEYAEGATVITSAVVDRTKVTQEALASVYDGTFEGGVELWPGAKEGVSKLAPWEHARFTVYTEEQYEQDLADLSNDVDGIASDMITPVDAPDIDTFLKLMEPVSVIDIIHIK
ncbi:MAG: BMP family ABC transporter substrate-binding protein [Clostridiales Family XIII bacterium]|jgi:basic membrane protein A|nr:BMP family ABC transporter substrate-binding protein [Clostridiales Family XIII bacterium]